MKTAKMNQMKKNKTITAAQSRPSLAERTFQTVLDNGLTVFICPRPGSGTVFAQTVIRTGSVHEGEDLGCGLSHFLEHMVFSGTKLYPGSTQIADNVNRYGGVLNASTGYSSTQYYMEVPSANAPDAIDMLGDMLTSPLFPEDRFLHEKNVILRESAMRKDNPYSHLLEALMRLMFPGHPAGVPIIGYSEKITQVNREQMKAYYERRYAPCRTAFIVSGDVGINETLDRISRKTGSWRPGRMDEVILPAIQPAARKTEISYNSPLAWLAMGFHEPDRHSPDHAALDVMSNVLAGTESARLIRKLKYQNALADEVSARRLFLPSSSLDLIFAVTAPEKAEQTLTGIRDVLEDLRKKTAAKAELARITTGLERAYWDVLSGNSGLGKIVSGVFASGGELEELDTYPDKIRSVTPEDVQAAAEKYYTPSLENLVVQMPEQSRTSRFKMPEKAENCCPVMKKLPDGQRLICVENHTRPMVFFKFCFRGGTLKEQCSKAGVSDLLAELLACGTKTYSEERFNTVLDDCAISLCTSSESDHIAVEASCMTQHIPQTVKLLKSMICEPLFSPETFEREREVLYRQLNDDMSDPVYAAKLKAKEALFGQKHPYGIPGKKVLEAVKKLTLRDVQDFYSGIMMCNDIAAGISGDCTPDDAFAVLEDILSGMKTEKCVSVPANTMCRKKGIKTVSENVRKAQSVVLYAMPSKCLKDFTLEDSLILQASNGMASRLFKTVREERGLAYYTSLSASISAETGWIGYLAGTQQGAEKQVLELFEAERKLRTAEGFTEEEFSAAAARLRFELVTRLQNPEKMLDACLLHEYRGAGCMRTLENLERLNTVTLKDMNLAAKKLFSCPFRVMTVASPEKFSDFPESFD